LEKKEEQQKGKPQRKRELLNCNWGKEGGEGQPKNAKHTPGKGRMKGEFATRSETGLTGYEPFDLRGIVTGASEGNRTLRKVRGPKQ